MPKDSLKETLIDRYMDTTGPTAAGGTSGFMAPTGLPVPPPGETAKVPPAWQRYLTGMKMQNAYANNWTPNPMLIRVAEGN